MTSPVNKVTVAVIGFDKLQPIPKHKLLGKTEFHLHKLAKVCDLLGFSHRIKKITVTITNDFFSTL